jgi:ribonuclease D
VQYDYIATQHELTEFCERNSATPRLAFDTEFVSEDRYRPELCLVQVATEASLAIIDPFAVDDLTPFWDLVAETGHSTIVHAGRYEFCFCLQGTGKRPQGLFDTQIAAGLIGLEYPAAYNTLLSRLLNKRLKKGETRTDWRRRPLSQRQLDYALSDVIDMLALHDVLTERLDGLGRMSWMATEMEEWQDAIETAEMSDRWRRVPGTTKLSARELAIVRELNRWREQEAKRQDRPPRRVLRDDLIVELARRQTADVSRIRAIRGLQRRDLGRHLQPIAESIATALEMPAEQCPKPPSRRVGKPQFTVLSQFLATALGAICRAQHVAPSLVGSLQDLRDLVWYRMDSRDRPGDSPPALARGWRKQLIGDILYQVLDGKMAVRIDDAAADEPLRLEAVGRVTGPATDADPT